MWVSIIKDLPIKNPPPILSVFWAVEWPREDLMPYRCLLCGQQVYLPSPEFSRKPPPLTAVYFRENADIQCLEHKDGVYPPRELGLECGCGDGGPLLPSKKTRSIPDGVGFGSEPNWLGAVKIVHKGRDVRVFPHEFTPLTDEAISERMTWGCYDLVAEDAPQAETIKFILDNDTRVLYEFALLEGAEENLAMIVAAGGTIEDDMVTAIPVMGWYKLNKEYARYFA